MPEPMLNQNDKSGGQQPYWSSGTVEANILALLYQARDIAAQLQAQGREVIDRNKYGFIKEQLPSIMGFDSFSLAEYTFRVSPEKSPGIRLWLGETRGVPTVSVILFPDVLRWRVDELGAKEQQTLVRFDLSGDEPRAVEGGVCVGDAGWKECLRRALGAAVEPS